MATSTGKKRRLRRRIVLIALAALSLLLAGTLAYLHSPWLARDLESRVERLVREATGRDCELTLSAVRPLTLSVEIERFWIAGEADGEPPFLELGESRIDARWGPLLRRRLALSELRVGGLRVDLGQLPSIGGDEPSAPNASPPTFAGLLNRIDVEQGGIEGATVRWASGDGSTAFESRDIDLRVLRLGLRRQYELDLRVGEADVLVPEQGRVRLSGDATAVLDRRSLRIEELSLRGDGLDLEAAGEWTRLSPPKIDAHFRVDLEPERLDLRSVAALRARGDVAAEGTLSWDDAAYRIDAELTAADAGVGDAVVSDLLAQVEGADTGWQADLSLRYAGQRIEGTATAAAPPGWFPLSTGLRWRTEQEEELAEVAALTGGPALRGKLEGSLDLAVGSPALESIEATLELTADRLRVGNASEALTANVLAEMTAGRVAVEQLSASAPGAALEGSGSAGLLVGGPGTRATLSARVIEPGRAAGLVRELLRAFGLADALPPELLAATGEIETDADLRGPSLAAFEPPSISGTLRARMRELSLAGEEGLGVSGDLRAVLAAGKLAVEEADLDSRVARLSLNGRADREGLDAATLVFSTESLGELLRRSMAELRAVGFGGAVPTTLEGLEGSLRFDAALAGPWAALDGVVEIEGHSLARGDLPGRELSADLKVADGRVRGEARLHGADSELAIVLDDVRWPAAGFVEATVLEPAPGWWLEAAGVELPLEGLLTAEGSVDLSVPAVSARASLSDGRLAGEPFELRDARLRWSPEQLEVSDAALVALGGELGIRGLLRDGDGRSSVEFTSEDDGIDLAEVGRILQLPLLLAGEARITGRLTGDPMAPQVDANLELVGLELEGRPQTPLGGAVSLRGRRLRVDLADPEGRSRIAVDTSLEGAPSWQMEARYFLDVELARVLGIDTGGGPRKRAGVVGTLVADISGRGGDPSSIVGTAEIEDLRLELDERGLTTRGGPRLTLEAGRAIVAPFDLVLGERELTIEGSLDTTGTPALRATAEGVLPLEPIAVLLPGTRMGGTSRVDLRVEGPLADLDWDGTIDVSDGRFSHPSMPSGFDAASARIRLRPSRWTLQDLNGRFGGGPVTGEGWLEPESRAFSLTLDAEQARLAFSEEFRAEGDAALTLAGAGDGTARLSGSLRISRAEYREDIDIEGQLLARTRELEAEIGGVGSFLDQIALDLEVQADDGVFVRNNLADFELRTTLDVGGTLVDPLASGQAAVLEGGEITFRGVTYQVSRGNLEYVSSPIDNPRLDIEAQTTVSRYDITLLATGPAADPEVTLSSSPPLPQADIVTLLLTGRTREDLATGGGGLSETQAAAYLTGSISKEVEGTLKSSLGLDEVRIDPVLVEGETDPTARITVGKQLTGKLSATYSRALSANQVDLYRVRYEPRERVALVGRNDEEDELLAEVLYNRRFYVGPERPLHDDGGRLEGRKVRAVSFAGNDKLATGRLRKDLGLNTGDVYRRSRLLSGLDAIRDRYLGEGHPEVEVVSEAVDREDGVEIVVTIFEGRHVGIRLDGWFLRKDVRRELLGLWRDTVFPDTLAEDAARLMRNRLRDLGFVRAEVQGRLTRDDETAAELLLTAETGERVRVDRIVVEGNHQLPESAIRAQMLTVEASLLGVLTPGWLNPSVLEQDLDAIRARYLSLGYLETPLPEVEILYPKSPRRAEIVIRIQEGSRYRLGEISFPGATSLDPAALSSAARLSLGEPYRDREVRNARSRLREVYDARGFSQVWIEPELAVDRATLIVDVAFLIHEGERRTVESVEIEGLALTKPWIAERELEIAAGEPLSSDEVARSRQGLYRTGLFRSVSVEQEPGQTEDARRITFKVEEGSNVRTDYGVGYSTDEGARGSITLSHINLFGRRVYGSVGARGSAVNWRVFGLARQPNLLGSRLEGLASASVEQEQKDAFDIRSIGATAQIDRRWGTGRSGWFLGYGLEEADIFQEGVEITRQTALTPELSDLIDLRDQSILRLGNLYVGAGRSTRDDFAWPTRGTVSQLKLSIFDKLLLSEPEFGVILGSLAWHRKLGNDLLWQGGVRLGLAEPYADTSLVPISERFFAGGDTSIRGFERDSIFAVGFPAEELAAGGIDVSESLGGNGLFVVNQELMVPLVDPIWLVAFYDAGNVYWTRSDWDFTDLRMSAGLGLRLKTPIGPLRLEYGWKLDREPEESRGRLHFSIGFPF